MSNIRNGNLGAKRLKEEVRSAVNMLLASRNTKRSIRQITDGTKFLDMLEKPPYLECRTVSQIKNKIKDNRNIIKEKLDEINHYMPGHQLNIFEKEQDITEEKKKEYEVKKKIYEAELHWLHKCLGMCVNRDYFN